MSQYNDTTASWLDNVLHEYENVADAPDYQTLCKLAKVQGRHLTEVMAEEGRKLYKSCTHTEKARANVHLVQNPALLVYQAAMGCTVIRRRPGQDLGPAKSFKEG